MSSTATPVAGPAMAVAGLGAALDQLTMVGGDELAALGRDGLLEVIKEFERIRNRMAVVDHAIVAACETSGLAEHHGLRSTATLLANSLLIGPGEARARVRAAEQLRPGLSPTGAPIPTIRPVLAAAAEDGTISQERMDTALRALERAERAPDATPDHVDTAERLLAEEAPRLGPRDLRRAADRIVDHLDPDGRLHDDRYHDANRSIAFWQKRDGSFRVEGNLTPGLGQKFRAVIDPLSKPQDGPDGEDLRTPEQRRHDGVETALDRLLRSGTLPDSGGTPTTVIVTIDWQDLINRTGTATFTDGTTIATETLLDLAEQADIIPTVLNASGAVLDLGRSRRLANAALTHALYVRDRGCTFPGCDVPPEWCERHHITAWIDGGATKLDNLTLLCRYHHHNFERLRWQCRMINKLPWWIPPRYLDPVRTPMINRRFRAKPGSKPSTPAPVPDDRGRHPVCRTSVG